MVRRDASAASRSTLMTRRHNSIRVDSWGVESHENYRSGLILTDKAVFVFREKDGVE